MLEVSTKAEMNQFIHFPKELYKNDRNFIFEPVALQREFLSAKNPFVAGNSPKYFLAKINGQVVGRIAAITNLVHNKRYNDNTGFFGFFEAIDNYEVAKILLDKVIILLKQTGFSKITGPVNFTTNDSCGMLTAGFDSPPVLMMPYNMVYYNDFLIKYGFEKEIDLSSYYIDNLVLTSSFFERLIKRITDRKEVVGISVRSVNYKLLEEEITPFCDIYNDANKDNWGFIPLTREEFGHTARQFRQFVPEKLMLIAEKNNEKIGFIVALPDLNQVFIHIKSGKLMPFGFLKYFWYKRRICNARILIFGVREDFRNTGIDALLYKRLQENLATLGIYHGEACYIMENNTKMHSIMKKIGGRKIKEYRIYKLQIT